MNFYINLPSHLKIHITNTRSVITSFLVDSIYLNSSYEVTLTENNFISNLMLILER